MSESTAIINALQSSVQAQVPRRLYQAERCITERAIEKNHVIWDCAQKDLRQEIGIALIDYILEEKRAVRFVSQLWSGTQGDEDFIRGVVTVRLSVVPVLQDWIECEVGEVCERGLLPFTDAKIITQDVAELVNGETVKKTRAYRSTQWGWLRIE